MRKQLESARAFVVDKKLMTLSSRDNLKVIETPAFLRSQLGVAAFDGAPPLQPELGAFYYVTPFPSDWPKEKVEAKLREYNRYMLELLTIHEAMPGHYVQFERANEVQPETRRVLRWVLGAGSYVEGWAVYAQDLMVDAGYLHGDVKLRLQQYKLELRAVTNAILDIKLHTQICRRGRDQADDRRGLPGAPRGRAQARAPSCRSRSCARTSSAAKPGAASARRPRRLRAISSICARFTIVHSVKARLRCPPSAPWWCISLPRIRVLPGLCEPLRAPRMRRSEA